MSDKDLSLKPFHLTKEWWYYEDSKGIEILHEIKAKGKYVRTDNITIPWRKILASVKRKQK